MSPGVPCGAAGMVWSRERDSERPPLSVILPQLYLGAESDVTQVRSGLRVGGGGSILWRPLTYGKYQLCKETCHINAPGFSKVKWGRLSKVNWGYCYTAAEAPIRMLLYHYIACVTALLLLLDSDHVLVSETANWTSQWNVVERQAQPLKCDWLVGITTSVRANWTMMNL